MTARSSDEYLDLVDRNDQVIGRKLRSEVYAGGLTNFRVINAFLRREDGRLWIPRRGPTKRIFPLALDMSVGGHVESGESYDAAFRRETQEELGLDVTQVPYRLVGHFTPHEHGLSAFMRVYEIRSSDVPNYNREDFVEWIWLTPKEVLDRIEAGDTPKSDLPKLVRLVYPN